MIYVAEKEHGTIKANKKHTFKGTVSRYFSLLVFFMNRFFWAPDYNIMAGHFSILQKFARKIFVAQGASPTVQYQHHRQQRRKILIRKV
jgi:hypothetical protein